MLSLLYYCMVSSHVPFVFCRECYWRHCTFLSYFVEYVLGHRRKWGRRNYADRVHDGDDETQRQGCQVSKVHGSIWSKITSLLGKHVLNAKLTETRIFRELSIEIESSLIELKSSLIQLKSSLIQLESSLI